MTSTAAYGSKLKTTPTPLAGVGRLHVEFFPDPYAVERYLIIKMPHTIVMSGIYVETLQANPLKKFTLQYKVNELTDPFGSWKDIGVKGNVTGLENSRAIIT